VVGAANSTQARQQVEQHYLPAFQARYQGLEFWRVTAVRISQAAGLEAIGAPSLLNLNEV